MKVLSEADNKFKYCPLCHSNTESDCYCKWLLGYDTKTGLPVLMTFKRDDQEQAILERIVQYLADLKDLNRISIEAEGFSKEFNFSVELIEALVWRRTIIDNRRK